MNKKSLLIWVGAFLITLLSAYYQRKTGPTYPMAGKISIENETVKFSLPRSEGGRDAEVKIDVKDSGIGGWIEYKRFKVEEEWTKIVMSNTGGHIVASLPVQPPAGKLEYKVFIGREGNQKPLTDAPVVIRFKGDVPAYVLIPHVIFMFLAMLISFRAGLEVLFKGNNTYRLTWLTLIFLGAGGMILGPVVQKFAFGAYWTGWPFGQDLTDNKTLVAFLAWLIAFFRLRRNRDNTAWVLVASVVLLLVYLIPHSMFGSELDYSTGSVNTGK